MKEYPLSLSFALIGLDGLESTRMTAAKRAVLRGVAAARLVEQWLEETQELPHGEVLEDRLSSIRSQKKQDAAELEQEVVSLLKKDGSLEEVPDLLACDMNYETAGVEIKAYRADAKEYLGITEWLRAEVLEGGEMTAECVAYLWLLRESCCIHELFSAEEQKTIARRMKELAAENEIYRVLWQAEFHSGLESMAVGFLKAKRNLFRNPYLEGVNLLFPFLERRQAIFIDFVLLGTTVAGRRVALMEFLSQKGHYVQEVKYGSETLLKIDNAFYRVFPKTVSCNRIPIQGANLVPVYL